MSITVLFSDSGTVRIFGIDGIIKGDSIEIQRVRLTSAGSQAAIALGSSIFVPSKLLEKPQGGGEDDRVFRKLSDVVDEEIAALRERLRNELSQELKIKIDTSNSYFGVQQILNTAIQGTLRLRLPNLDGGGSTTVVLAARARASTNIQVGTATISATLVLAVDATATVRATFLWEAPSWPAFNLPLPQFDFSTLSFSNLAMKILPDKWPAFALPALPFAENLSFRWTTQPNLQISVDAHGVLALQTVVANGAGDLWFGDPMHGGTRITSLTGFGITASASKIAVAGTVTLSNSWTPPDRTIRDDLPFDVTLKGIMVSATLTAPISQPQPDFQIKLSVREIRIQARKDPSLFLVLTAVFVVNDRAQQVQTKIQTLKVIEPYAIDLIINGAQTLTGALMRLSLPISTSLPNLLPFLTRVADMLTASAIWLVERAGQAAQALAAVAESAFAVLNKAIAAILQAGASAPVQIEVRLEPATYRLRQILITPKDFSTAAPTPIDALGLKIVPDHHLKPCVVIDLGEHSWIGVALVNEPPNRPSVKLSTDLWLSRSTSAAQPVKAINQQSGQKDADPLLLVTATLKKDCALVLFSFQEGRLGLFQKSAYGKVTDYGFVCVGETGVLEPLNVDDVTLDVDTHALQNRLTNLLTKPKSGHGSNHFLEALESHVKVTSADQPKVDLDHRTITITIKLTLTFREFKASADATLILSLRDLSARLEGADRISISLPNGVDTDMLGFHLNVAGSAEKQETFYLDLSGGKEEFGLGKDAKASLLLAGLASDGGGLRFNIGEFRIGRDGLNLSAAPQDDPVTLGGVNMPFHFQSGKIEVINSQLKGASLSGSGQLPPALIGEANVSINLRLKDDCGHVVVDSAEAKLDKADNPIVCESTRFQFSISKLEMAFEREGAGGNGNYHFYFLLTGKARFQPRAGEFASGLLKNLNELEIILDRAPLTGDGRLLMQRISFQAKVDPPRKSRFFDLFEFELRGIGLHPSAPAFDGSPALSISGQVKFTSFADKIQPTFRFHELWIAPPEQGKILPRIRFDGLTVGLDLGGMAEVEGTAVAVDGSLPTLLAPGTLPANVTANGFLASGRLSIKGWASMSAAMGFLELRKKGESESRLAFFLYIQANKLSVPIPTPVGKIYLREVGFGFGWHYTLAGIAEAERVNSPKDLIRVLDDVSKYQGSLDQIEAWTPTYDSATLTLAMRAMFSLNSASQVTTYEAEKEKDLPNPVLFDVIAAIRSDLTFLMSVRAWLCVNYADWLNKSFEGRTRPPLRGYLYISVPKQTFLGRFIGDSTGFLGKHPDLPAPMRKALEFGKIQYSSTLFITPGLFHFELGWPYELSVELGDRNGNFYIGCEGGYVFRVEDGAILNGYALRALGFAQLGVSTGGSFGAAVYARADFAIEGQLLSYLSLRAPGETMFYGAFRFDVHVSVSVRVWLEFRVFGGTIHWELGFSFGVTLAVGLEVAVLLNRGIGLRVYASIGIQAFGRTLSLGVELRLGGGVLDEARARVDRYLALGLTVSAPQPETIGRPPAVEPSRKQSAMEGDKRIEQSANTVPLPPPTSRSLFPTRPPADSQPVEAADFWAMLFPTTDLSHPDQERYVMQLIPRDLTGRGSNKTGSFYAPMSANRQKPTHAITLPHEMTGLTSITLNDRNEVIATPNDPKLARGYSRRLDADVWQENFVVWTTLPQDRRPNHCDDPPSITWGRSRTALPAADAAAARALELSGRQLASQSTEQRRYRQIEERRSAMIAAVANSASSIAKTGEAGNWWTFDTHVPLSCLDLGLTFVVSLPDLEKLFPGYNSDTLDGPPRSPDFKVIRYNDEGNPSWDKGDVFLFNPPKRMFYRMQPRLKDLSMELTHGGLALNWDLEPAWKASENFWTDPEFHLRNYQITRVISAKGTSRDQRWSCYFNVKAGAPSVYKENPTNPIERPTDPVFYRPPFQFFDDLTQPPNLPPEVRALILGKLTDQQIPDLYKRRFTVTYEIYAEDVAGTRDSGTPVEYDFDPPEPTVAGPRAAEVLVEFSASIATDNQRVDLSGPERKLSLTYAGKSAAVSRLQISVVSGKPLPSGQYGADAISTALESVADGVIENGDKFRLQTTGRTHSLMVEFAKFDDVTGQPLDPVQKKFYFESHTLRTKFDGLLQGQATLRIFLRESQLGRDGKERYSAWHKCPVHLKVKSEAQPGRVLVDSVLDNYERPQDLAFEPILRNNFTDVHSGRMYVIEPTDDVHPGFKVVPDPNHRTGVRLRWKARPDGLVCNGGPATDNWRLVGGFHLYCYDVLQENPSQDNPVPIPVALLPQSVRGLEPSEMGDMSLIESYYPTNATRRTWKARNYTGWFSLAESAPLFPEEAPFRRSFMASVDEGLLAALFEQGIATHLELTTQSDTPPPRTVLDDSWISSAEANYKAGYGWEAAFQPAKVRRFFRDACLKKRLKDGTKVSITAYRKDKDSDMRIELVTRQYLFEDSAHLHPLLADTLDMMRYAEPLEKGDQAYRQYEIVLDPLPGRTIDDLEGWIDSTPVNSDPYGWGILRTLGLAVGFRVYDTAAGMFLTGQVLHGLVSERFDLALARYTNLGLGAVDIGTPFIDLFTAPLENMRVYSFDGGPDSASTTDVYNAQVAVIQISLRPRIHALTNPDTAGIRYFVIPVSESTSKASDWIFTLNPTANYTVDLFTLRASMVTQHAILVQSTAQGAPLSTAKFTLGPVSKGDLVFAIRVVGTNVPNSSGSIVMVQTNVAHDPPRPVDLKQAPVDAQGISSGVGEVLGLFPPLTRDAWASQFSIASYLQRFYRWTERAKLTRKPMDRVLAGKLANWWKRFLDHGWGKASDKVETHIRESLGSIGKPGKWRVAEDPAGTVGVVLVEEAEYGAMKRYTVRPYGRYEALLRSVNSKLREAPAIAADTVVDVTLPRTAPATRPTILSAARVPVEVPDDTGVVKERGEALELVVARTADEIISSANQTTALGLASDGVSVGFWREFAHLTWGRRILGDTFTFDTSLGGWDRSGSAPDLTLTASSALSGVRSRVPDAWLGAWIYRMRALPYFYRVHALVHANAGVVVSEPAGATFLEGISKLAWFPDVLYPSYRVWIDSGMWKIEFKIPLIAFRDCMINAMLWDTTGDFARLVLLPDPAITYRVSLAASAVVEANKDEVLSADSQFEISPVAKPDDRAHLYVVQSVGERMKGAPTELGVSSPDNMRYQVCFQAQTNGPPLPPPVGPFTTKVPWIVTKPVTAARVDFPVWKRFAPTGTAQIVYTKPSTSAEEATLKAVCKTMISSYTGYADDAATKEIVRVLKQIQGFPASQTFTVPNWIIGLPQTVSPALVFKFGGDFVWNPKAKGTRQERRLVELYIAASHQQDLRADLRRHYLSGKSLYLRQNITQREFSDPKNLTSQSTNCAPYQVLAVNNRHTTFDRARLEALFDKLETSPFGAETIAGLAIVEDFFADAAAKPARLVLGTPQLLADLQGLFALEDLPTGYFVAWLSPPGSPELDPLGDDSAFRRKAITMAEEVWFGVHRKPRLSAVRGTQAPIHKEIRRV
ncbi:MAG: hypothetical protein ACLP59_16160 [Bryobacteraceae bacterium]